MSTRRRIVGALILALIVAGFIAAMFTDTRTPSQKLAHSLNEIAKERGER